MPRPPASLRGAPLLLPVPTTAVRRELDEWFDRLEVSPRVIAEFDDSALLKVFGQAGEGLFVSPSDQRLKAYQRAGVAVRVMLLPML